MVHSERHHIDVDARRLWKLYFLYTFSAGLILTDLRNGKLDNFEAVVVVYELHQATGPFENRFNLSGWKTQR